MQSAIGWKSKWQKGGNEESRKCREEEGVNDEIKD